MGNLLPINATEMERALLGAISEEMGYVKTPARTLMNIEICDEVLLGYVAWGLSVDEWDEHWSVERKRKVIKTSVEVHKSKGTMQSTRLFLQSILDSEVQVVEPQRSFGEEFGQYVFDIVLQGVKQLDKNLKRVVLQGVERLKPVHSHVHGLFYRHPYSDGALKYDGSVLYDGGEIE